MIKDLPTREELAEGKVLLLIDTATDGPTGIPMRPEALQEVADTFGEDSSLYKSYVLSRAAPSHTTYLLRLGGVPAQVNLYDSLAQPALRLTTSASGAKYNSLTVTVRKEALVFSGDCLKQSFSIPIRPGETIDSYVATINGMAAYGSPVIAETLQPLMMASALFSDAFAFSGGEDTPSYTNETLYQALGELYHSLGAFPCNVIVPCPAKFDATLDFLGQAVDFLEDWHSQGLGHAMVFGTSLAPLTGAETEDLKQSTISTHARTVRLKWSNSLANDRDGARLIYGIPNELLVRISGRDVLMSAAPLLGGIIAGAGYYNLISGMKTSPYVKLNYKFSYDDDLTLRRDGLVTLRESATFNLTPNAERTFHSSHDSNGRPMMLVNQTVQEIADAFRGAAGLTPRRLASLDEALAEGFTRLVERDLVQDIEHHLEFNEDQTELTIVVYIRPWGELNTVTIRTILQL